MKEEQGTAGAQTDARVAFRAARVLLNSNCKATETEGLFDVQSEYRQYSQNTSIAVLYSSDPLLHFKVTGKGNSSKTVIRCLGEVERDEHIGGSVNVDNHTTTPSSLIGRGCVCVTVNY